MPEANYPHIDNLIVSTYKSSRLEKVRCLIMIFKNTQSHNAYIAKANEIAEALESKNFYIDGGIKNAQNKYFKGGLTFSLIPLGLQGVYATISEDEIQYHAENDEV